MVPPLCPLCPLWLNAFTSPGANTLHASRVVYFPVNNPCTKPI